MKPISQFARKSIFSIATQFFLLVGSIVANVITARSLGAAGRGQLALLLLIPTLATSFGRLGIGHAVNYYASRTSASKLIVNSVILSVILSVVVVVVGVPVIFSLKDVFFRDLGTQLISVAVLCIPLFMLNGHFVSLLQGFYKIELFNSLLLMQSTANILLLLMLVWFLKLGLSGALVAAVASLAVVLLLAAVSLAKQLQIAEAKLDGGLIKSLLHFGFKSHIGNLLKDLSYRGDILLVGYFLSASEVGYYVIAVIIAEILWKIPDAVGSVLLPRVAHLDRISAWSFTPIVSRLVLVPVSIGCVSLLLIGKALIVVAFGQAFAASFAVLLALLPGVLSVAVWKILANDLIAQGRPVTYSVTSAIALTTMVVLDVLLIPRYGIVGAAVASSISYVAATVSIVYVYVRLTGNPISSLLIPRYSDIQLVKAIRCGN